MAHPVYHLDLIQRLQYLLDPQLHWIEKITALAPVVDCQFGPLVITHHAWIEDILIKHTSTFVKSQTYYELMKQMLGEGLLTSDGTSWQLSRHSHQQSFTPQRFQQAMAPLEQITQAAHDKLSTKQTLRLDLWLNTHVTELFFTLLTGIKDASNHHELFQLIQVCNEETSRTNPFLPPIKQRNRCKKTLSRLHIILLETAAKATPDGLLYPLVAAYQNKTISHHHYLSEMKNFFVAGAETTATSLQWFFSLVMKHPKIYQQLCQQIRCKGEDHDYIDQCIMESLRLYPPIWCMLRRSTESTTIQNFTIKKNRSLVISPYALHRSPHYWDQPNTFKPERFQRDHIKERPKNCYIPFGLGPRVCIGKHLAIMVMKHIATSLLGIYDCIPKDQDFSMEAQSFVTLQRRHPLNVKLSFC